jgi:hypothetical protein
MGPKPYAVFAVLATLLCLTPKAHAQQPEVAAKCLTDGSAPSLVGVKVDIIDTSNGKVVTDQRQTIMTGQPVGLVFKVSGAGVGKRIFGWQVSPTVNGGYFPKVQEGKVIAPQKATSETQRFYWIDPGVKAAALAYRLWVNVSGRVYTVTGRACTTFNVQGPTNVKVTARTKGKSGDPKACTDAMAKDPPDIERARKLGCMEFGKLQFFTDTDKDGKVVQEVGLGLSHDNSVGIQFEASATMPSGGSGKFIWVQKVIADKFLYRDTNPARNQEGHGTGGLDRCTPERCKGTLAETYQFGTGPITNDSPSIPLGLGNPIDQNRTFEASMYLMWQADADGSIPVPLGLINWNTYWNLAFVPSQGGWKILRGDVNAFPFAPSIVYPEWNKPNVTIYVPPLKPN